MNPVNRKAGHKMNRKATRLPKPIVGVALLLVLAAIVMTGTSPAAGQATAPPPAPGQTTAAGYGLSWGTVDGGGDTHVSSGPYTLGGTIGQPDSAGQVTSPSYSLLGGFWAGARIPYRFYLPLISHQ